MSQSIYEQAIADAKKVREVAEENAKKAVLESVTPRIREFIEEQLLESKTVNELTQFEEDEEADVAAIDSQEEPQPGSGITNPMDETVKLDESAIMTLVELLGGDDAIESLQEAATNEAMMTAVQAALGRLSDKERQKLFEIAEKIERNANKLTSSDINNDIHLKENDNMSKDKFYEVDLKMLREAVMNESRYGMDKGDEFHRRNVGGHEVEAGKYGAFMEEDSDIDDNTLEEIMASLNEQDEEAVDVAALFGDEEEVDVDVEEPVEQDEEEVDVEITDSDLPPQIEEAIDDLEAAIASVLGGAEDALEDAEGEIEDAEEDLAGGEEVEVEVEEEDFMNEVFEIDPNVLKRELRRMRKQIKEGKVGDNWGGKGDAKVGVDGSYGGKGKGNAGVKGSFGGGKEGKDAFTNPPQMNKLSEAIRKLRRTNRTQNEKLNKYRSAVQTLREQLEDLNLFNAKLLYVNKLLQNKSLQESQKKSIIKALDQANSLNEAKMLYKSLTESLSNTGSKTISESRTRGSSSRATTSSSSAPKAMTEVNRWATLAGLNK
jgi:hypothetical protein